MGGGGAFPNPHPQIEVQNGKLRRSCYADTKLRQPMKVSSSRGLAVHRFSNPFCWCRKVGPLHTKNKKRVYEMNPTSSRCPDWGGDEPPETGIHTQVPWPPGYKEAESGTEMLRPPTWCNPTCGYTHRKQHGCNPQFLHDCYKDIFFQLLLLVVKTNTSNWNTHMQSKQTGRACNAN